jgi:O-antigen ligase
MIGVAAGRVLKGATIAGVSILLAWLLATEDVGWVPLLFGAVAVAIAIGTMVTSKWPLGAMLALILSSAAPRFAWSVGELHVRPEHFAIGLVILLILWPSRHRELHGQMSWRSFDICLLVYLGINFLTSGLTSPEPHLTLRWALLVAVVLSPYFIVRWLIVREETLVTVFRMVLVAGVAEAIYGILCFLSSHLFGTTFGTEFEQYGSKPGIYGTQYEANVFGSYTACCALMCLAGYLFDRKDLRRWYLWSTLIAFLGALISLSRAVLLSLPLLGGLLVWLAIKRGRIHVRSLTLLATALLGGLLLLGPMVIGLLQERFSTLDLSQVETDETTARRVVGIKVAMNDVMDHPWLGTGANSFRLMFDWNDYWPNPENAEGDIDERGAWIGNTEVRVLHDTGIVGFVVFLAFLTKLLLEVRTGLRRGSDSMRAILIALTAGIALYAITFQATDATTLSFAWIHVGLLAAATTVVRSTYRDPLSFS